MYRKKGLAVRVNDACDALGIGRSTLYGLIKTKKIKSALIAGRRVIPVNELRRILDENTK